MWQADPNRRGAPSTSSPGRCEQESNTVGENCTMATWRPDPTFYPSPRMAMRRRKKCWRTWRALILHARCRMPWRSSTSTQPPRPILRSSAPSRCQIRATKLHHFGWNRLQLMVCARTRRIPTSSGRYLVVPGLRSCASTSLISSRTRDIRISSKWIEPEEVADKAGYTRPHTVHCGPEGIYVAALGNAEGEAPAACSSWITRPSRSVAAGR